MYSVSVAAYGARVLSYSYPDLPVWANSFRASGAWSFASIFPALALQEVVRSTRNHHSYNDENDAHYACRNFLRTIRRPSECDGLADRLQSHRPYHRQAASAWGAPRPCCQELVVCDQVRSDFNKMLFELETSDKRARFKIGFHQENL
jgi:hypothetical protein